jgi:transcription elongation factor GreA
MENGIGNSEYLSQQGFERLKKELTNLKSKRRKEIAERLEYAKSLGDLAENAEYQEAKEEQQALEARIAELEDILNRAVLISHPETSAIDLGSTVKARKEGVLNEETYFIVGSEEADPSSNRISNESPLGRALLGKKKGDTVNVQTPRGEIKYHIVEII